MKGGDGVCRCRSVATVAPADTIIGEGRGATSTLDPAKGERAEAALLPKNPLPSPNSSRDALWPPGYNFLWPQATGGSAVGQQTQLPPPTTSPHHSGGAPRPSENTPHPGHQVLHAQVRETTACTTAPPAGEQKSVLSAPGCSLSGSNLPEQEKNSDFNCTSQGTTHRAP